MASNQAACAGESLLSRPAFTFTIAIDCVLTEIVGESVGFSEDGICTPTNLGLPAGGDL